MIVVRMEKNRLQPILRSEKYRKQIDSLIEAKRELDWIREKGDDAILISNDGRLSWFPARQEVNQCGQ